jgi:hypothetical protein
VLCCADWGVQVTIQRIVNELQARYYITWFECVTTQHPKAHVHHAAHQLSIYVEQHARVCVFGSLDNMKGATVVRISSA